MLKDKKLSILLVVGIVALVFLLSRQYFFRLDLTEDKEFTMSKATKNILHGLEDPVDVKAYFSDNLPAEFERVKTDFQNLLIEYNNISKGKVNFQFINPGTNRTLEQEAAQNGIQPILINVREKDEASQKKAYMGAVVEYGDQKEVLPFINRESPMEYDLTTAIKKISVKDKPSLGFLESNGEPQLSQMPQVVKALSVIYTVENVDLNKDEKIADRIKALVIVNPKDSIPDAQFKKLDDYLAGGGKIIAAVNAVDGDFSTATGSAVKNNILTWLASHGITIDPTFVVDASCGKVSVQQRIGNFNIPTQINFPYLPLIKTFPNHPATTGIEAVLFQFASPIKFNSTDGSVFTPLITSSNKAGTINTPLQFDVQKQWTQADFPLANIPLGGAVEGMKNPESKLVVFSDGDFVVSQEGNLNPDNVNLMLNTVEWLVDKSGLAELRNKGIVYRPIKDLEEGKRTFTKYFNFLFPLALVGIVGIWRSQRNRRKRHQRMEEKYV